jgi:hypothetical protein
MASTRNNRRAAAVFGVAAALIGAVLPSAFAAPSAPSLSGSNFEIETDANLKLDDVANLDWASVSEIRRQDADSGSGDNAFGQGTKEDDAVPTIVSGSIPPNKSDLKYFGVYQEGSSSAGFLHLYWARVQDPSGTTNMDFEFNQKKCVINGGSPTPDSECSANGVTPVRTINDLLITYDLAKGGTQATISRRSWTGSAWGPATDFGANAVGTINSTQVPAADADGLGSLDPRTFGEASLRLSAVLPASTSSCTGFGSAYLKSRSSDSFTSAVKDFIAPEPVNLTNCGSINIVKTDDASPANALNGAVFTLYTDVNNAPGVVFDASGDPGTQAITCTTAGTGTDAGKYTLGNVPFGSYWVKETTTPTGYDTAPDQQVTISSATPTVTLTFVDPRQRGAILITKTRKDKSAATGTSAHPGVSFTVKLGNDTLASGSTDANGKVCFDNLLFNTYSVVETVPANYQAEDGSTTTFSKNVTVDNKASCGADPYVGESVSFVNTPLSTVTVAFSSQATGSAGPATAAKISCASSTADLSANPADATPNVYDDTSESFINLPPGVYNCTVDVDP